MNKLIENLGLEFEPHFSWRKAISIFTASIMLLFGMLFATDNSPYKHVIAGVCFLAAIRIIMGSPVELVLTEHSLQKLNTWVDDSDMKD